MPRKTKIDELRDQLAAKEAELAALLDSFGEKYETLKSEVALLDEKLSRFDDTYHRSMSEASVRAGIRVKGVPGYTPAFVEAVEKAVGWKFATEKALNGPGERYRSLMTEAANAFEDGVVKADPAVCEWRKTLDAMKVLVNEGHAKLREFERQTWPLKFAIRSLGSEIAKEEYNRDRRRDLAVIATQPDVVAKKADIGAARQKIQDIRDGKLVFWPPKEPS